MDYQILSEEKWCACQAGEKSVKETFKDLSYFGSDGVWNYYGSITENGITTLMRIKQTFKKCKDCEKTDCMFSPYYNNYYTKAKEIGL